MSAKLDVLVIGAGPTGLACALELGRSGHRCVVLDKGCVVNSLARFPTNMVYFTTPELLEIGGYPLVCLGEKPTRLEALKYYRRVVAAERLAVNVYERVVRVTGADGAFEVDAERVADGEPRHYAARKLIVATGYYDHPNRLGVPGEELAKVSHYYTEAHPYFGLDVAVVGGANSAAEAALDLFRGGARVTLIHRRAVLSHSLKYWVAPDIANRIGNGEIHARMETELIEIKQRSLRLRRIPSGAEEEIPNDFVFALIGYHSEFAFLRELGVRFDPDSLKPELDPDSLESNVGGLYLAGVAIAGRENNKVFIENGRFHGRQIAAAIRQVLPSR